MDSFVVVRGRLCDPRHIELDDPAPIPEGAVEVALRSLAQGEAFWTERSIEDLAAEQGLSQPVPLTRLLGQGADLWDSDQDFRKFVDEIHAARRGPERDASA